MPDRHDRADTTSAKHAPALAREVGIAAVDDAFADDAYTIRSQAVHGTEVSFDDDPTVSTRLGLLQRVLQLALKRAIEDVGFRTTFASAEAIRARWPVATTSGVRAECPIRRLDGLTRSRERRRTFVRRWALTNKLGRVRLGR